MGENRGPQAYRIDSLSPKTITAACRRTLKHHPAAPAVVCARFKNGGIMKRVGILAGALGVVATVPLWTPMGAAQVATPVDFVRDVQPILRQQCYGCHGPTQQMNGFRLDRRRDAMRGGTIAVIGPGNSDGSRLYQRLIGQQYGQQMPPTGALQPEQIRIIKA